MKCSKPRFAFRPLVEHLESRLQPGSVITGQGYGWSLLADSFSILDQPASDSPGLVSRSLVESSQPAPPSSAPDAPREHLALAVASAAARSENSGLPAGSPMDSPLGSWTNDDLPEASLTGHAHSVPLAPVATLPLSQQISPATPQGSVPQSPLGVAAPAASMAGASNSPQVAMAPMPAASKVNGQLVNAAPLVSGPSFHVTTQTRTSGPHIDSRSSPAWATYIGSTGDDRLLGIALDPNASATQPIVVVGFTQNPTDSTDFEGLVARVSNDGTSATLFDIDMGSNSRTELHSAAVDPNDGSIYVTGLVTQNGTTTDLIARVHADLSTVDWTVSHQAAVSAVGNSVHLDSTGTNLYVTGGLDGNLYVTQLTNLSSAQPTVVFDSGFQFQDANGNNAPSVGNGVAPDSAGNVNVALQIQSTPDAEPAVFQINPAGTLTNWGYSFRSMGPNGTMNGVYVDSSDNVFVTGGVGVSNPPLVDEVIAEFDSSGNQLNGIRIYGIDTQGNPSGQWLGYSIQTDSSGNVFTAVTDAGPDLVGNIAFLVVDPGFSQILQTEGDAYGSNDDQNRGLVLDPANSALYQAGFTNSPDFNYTTGTFQSTYGGDPYDGVVIGYHVA